MKTEVRVAEKPNLYFSQGECVVITTSSGEEIIAQIRECYVYDIRDYTRLCTVERLSEFNPRKITKLIAEVEA